MDFKVGILLLTAFIIAFAGKGRIHWGYEETGYGPGDWGRVAQPCTRQSQSPININTRLAQINAAHHGLVLNIAQNKYGAVIGSLSNNGHDPTVLVDKSKVGVTLTGGPLGQTFYILRQIHFHFGCNSSVGSEHTVDGNPFAAEMNLIFYNSMYPNFQVAASKPNGLAVIAVFLQVDGGFNQWMEFIAVLTKNVKRPNGISQYNLGYPILIPLTELVPDLATTTAPYYTYKGSLTTPPCYESVQWIVMRNTISITECQLEIMRSLTTSYGHPLCNNFRPVNPLNGRKLFKWPGGTKLPGLLN